MAYVHGREGQDMARGHALTAKDVTAPDGRKAVILLCACGNTSFLLGMSQTATDEHTVHAICTKCPRKHELAYYMQKTGN
jgi:hypothetical protein